MTANEQKQFVLDRLRDNPALTKNHFIRHCSINKIVVEDLATSGVMFGSSTKYREIWRNTPI